MRNKRERDGGQGVFWRLWSAIRRPIRNLDSGELNVELVSLYFYIFLLKFAYIKGKENGSKEVNEWERMLW